MQTLIDHTVSFLNRKNAKIELNICSPISVENLSELLKENNLSFHESLIKFYTQFSNGLELNWSHNEGLEDEEYGNLEIPSIKELIDIQKEFFNEIKEWI